MGCLDPSWKCTNLFRSCSVKSHEVEDMPISAAAPGLLFYLIANA
jgi:hypothetical protein